MGRLTPFGTLLMLIVVLVVGGGALAATDNLRWPPRGFENLAAATAVVPPGAAATQPPAASAPDAVATPAAPAPAQATALPAGTAVAATDTVPPPTATTPPTATPTNTPAPTATPTPLGLVYVGALDLPKGNTPGGGAQPAAVDPDTHRLFVINADAQGRGVLSVYDESTLQKQADVTLDINGVVLDTGAPVPVLVSAATHRIFVVARSGRVATLDSVSLAPGPSYNMGQAVDRAFLNADGTKLFGLISDQPGSRGPELRVLELRNVATSAILIPARWSADAAFSDGATIYITGRDGLLPLDMRAAKFGAPIVLGFQPLFPVFDAANRRLYAWRQPVAVPLTPQLVVYTAADWKEELEATRAGCPCPLAFGVTRPRLYLSVPGSPGAVLAYSQPGALSTFDEVVLNPAPALAILPSRTSNRLYVQTDGRHSVLVLQDNGPAPGRQPVQVDVSK